MKGILRLITAGSVDDGKSTLIGRLLHDTKSIYKNQLDSIKRSSEEKGLNFLDLSMLTDGLKEERQRGITIDVAYRYFTTPKRKFILADCPGHAEFTRNMVTGASTSNAAILLIDAKNGVVEQTKRHLFIMSLLQIKHVIVCINKMDLVGYSETVFNGVVDELEAFIARLEINDYRFIPVSALHGDNIVNPSLNMNWYRGSALLHELETISISPDRNLVDCRLPIQLVFQGDDDTNYYAGRVESGIFKKGDSIATMPKNETCSIDAIYVGDNEVEEAFPPMSVSLRMNKTMELKRGDMLVRENNQATTSNEFDAMMCWLSENRLDADTNYLIKHTTKESHATICEIAYKVNINTLHRILNDEIIEMNDIARVKITADESFYIDSYKKNRALGSVVLIDQKTKATVAAGMII